MFKKVIAVVLTLVLAVSFAAPALAASQEARVVIGADNTESQIASYLDKLEEAVKDEP